MVRRVIVTGGTGAVGRDTCRALAARDTRVGFTWYRSEEAARALLDELPGACARRVDLSRAEEVAPALSALADELGGVDALVCCAAVPSTREPPVHDLLTDFDPDGWDRMMAVNVKAAALGCRALVDRFGEEGGNVVFLGSINGLKPVPSPTPYATSKAALLGLAQALAKELGPRRVRVNVVAPGILDTGSSAALRDELREEYVKHSGLKRFGTAAETARAVAFFALDNVYVTGQAVVLDGGL